MIVLDVRNAHEALPIAVQYLQDHGIRRQSRNGPVLLSDEPVTTSYSQPTERCVFYQDRDYNVFFNVYEALWMLAGMNDVKPLLRYVKSFGDFSDDGLHLNGAYGHR